MNLRSAFFAALLCASSASAATLPGFRVEKIAPTTGFLTSLDIDSTGTVYYTNQAGAIFRLDGNSSTLVATVPTAASGDSGLIGMALRDDHTAAVHYTTPNQVSDVISLVDLTTGAETRLHEFICDQTDPSRGTSPEHHGGIPTVVPDGSVFVGIGDYGGRLIAAFPEWNGGKIWHVLPDGSADQYALGFRNPFGITYDAANQRLVVADNGDAVNDEIDIVTRGGNYGWPYTAGTAAPIEGDIPPAYTFPVVVAPTGMLTLRGRNPILQHGYVVGSFVTKAIYWFPDLGVTPVPDPLPLIQAETPFVIDVAEAPDGTIWFGTPFALYRLDVPQRGDCNGDGLVNAADVTTLLDVLSDANPQPMTAAPFGKHPGSFGCDVNGDGVIDTRDLVALGEKAQVRVRAVRGR